MMAQSNTLVERETYAIAVRQDAFERSEEAKRKYRQSRSPVVEAVSKNRRRSNLIRSKYGKGFALSVLASLILMGIATNRDRLGIDRLDLTVVSDYARNASADLGNRARVAYESVVARFPSGTTTESVELAVGSTSPKPVFAKEGEATAGQPTEPSDELTASMKPPTDEPNELAVDTTTIIDVPFALSISHLGPKGESAVAGIAMILGNPRSIEVVGMAGQSEDKDLATMRSVSVLGALVRAGIDPAIVKISGVSFESPMQRGEVTGARITTIAEISDDQIKPTAITPGAALSEVSLPARKPAFPLIPTPLTNAESRSLAKVSAPVFRAPAQAPTPEAEPVAEPAVDDGLTAAIEAAVRRRAGGTADQKPKQARPSVDVEIRTRTSETTNTNKLTKAPADVEKPVGTAYSIIRVLEQGLLVREGNQVLMVKQGKSMPDGKVLDSTDVAAGTYVLK